MTKIEADAEFINFLNEVGSDFALTQGVGGNSSIKSKGLMLVKASGKRLGEADSPDYFYEVEVEKGKYRDSLSLQDGRPSIEVFLHALLPHKYVLHLHSAKGVALSMLSATKNDLKSSLSDKGVFIIGYHKPGIELKNAVKARIDQAFEDLQPKTFLLQNHGTLFGANSVKELKDAVISFEEEAAKRLGVGLGVSITPNNLTDILDKDVMEHIQWHALNNWRISPDHIVFLGANPPAWIIQNPKGTSTTLGMLEIAFPDAARITPREEQLIWFINVIQFLPRLKLPTLTEEEATQLISWDAEKHRLASAFKEN